MEDLNKNVIEIGTLDPDKALMTQYRIKLDKSKGVNLNIFFSANNGFTTQILRMRLVNEKWELAERIIRLKDNEELYLKIDSNYPIKDKNQIFK